MKSVLFDFDGTIIHSSELIYGGLTYIARRYAGKELCIKELNMLVGKSLRQQMEYLLGERCEEGMLAFNVWYLKNHNRLVEAVPGLEEVLQTLHNEEYRMGIISNNRRSTIKRGLEWLQLTPYFEIVLGIDDVNAPKPHPEGALRALAELDSKRSNSIYIGDSISDVETAINAGIPSVLVGWSSIKWGAEQLMQPDYLANDPQELLRIITNNI